MMNGKCERIFMALEADGKYIKNVKILVGEPGRK
jgi:hypothetical protein